jgi:sugar lactone lactonase YvrE
MIQRWRAEVAAPEVHALGEGPVWDGPRDRLLWVDILAGTVHAGRLDGWRVVRTGSYAVDLTVGAVAPGRTGEMLVAGTESLLVLGADGDVTPGPRILPAGSGRRLNDGACDPDGAFLVGSLAFDERPGGESLVRIGADRSVTTVDDGLSLSNGLGWSPDGSLFYSIDTIPGIVYVREHPFGERRTFLQPDDPPDGMRVDADGNLWIAFWGTGEVRRFSPGGELTGVVEVDAPNVTCVAFAGPGLDRLIITTATKDLSPEQLDRHPDAGRLFIADVGAAGLPVTPWAGFTL